MGPVVPLAALPMLGSPDSRCCLWISRKCVTCRVGLPQESRPFFPFSHMVDPKLGVGPFHVFWSIPVFPAVDNLHCDPPTDPDPSLTVYGIDRPILDCPAITIGASRAPLSIVSLRLHQAEIATTPRERVQEQAMSPVRASPALSSPLASFFF